MTGPELAPGSRQSTAAIIAARLRDAITRGAFPPGAQLGEVELASRLGVSRGPLREAMQRLVQEGLLRGERHRGLFVVELGIDDVRDVYAARLAVEQAAARMVLGGRQDAAVRALTVAQQAIVSAAAAGDPVRLADADQDFHTALVRVSGSPRLQRMALTLLAETRMCLTALQATRPAPELLVREHQVLLDAVAAGDEATLIALLAEHMADAVARIETDLSDISAMADEKLSEALAAILEDPGEGPIGGPGTTAVLAATVPVTIYLSDEAAHQQVEDAVEDFLASAGAEVEHREEPVLGSWFRRIWTKLTGTVRSPLAYDAMTSAAHAIDTRLVLAQDAAVTADLLCHLAPVIAALEPVNEAVIRAGALLIVKVHGRVVVHQLTAAQQLQLDHQPNLAASPHEILSALQLKGQRGGKASKRARPTECPTSSGTPSIR